MESVVFFGKGGIGKSTLASNFTALLAAGGRKVLHIGCDPKMDSAQTLMGRHVSPFTAGIGGEASLRASIFRSPVRNVFCVEAGGPQPGVGCAGAGIGSMLDAMKDSNLLERDGYQALVFDVLGDVVCGGFAAPLRGGYAKKAVIVLSEEILSFYAANRLIQMINSYSRNGVYLAGLAVNIKEAARLGAVQDFARAVNTRVLGTIPWDSSVYAAGLERRPAVLAYPGTSFSRGMARLTAAITASRAPKNPPRPMTDADFFAFTGELRNGRSGKGKLRPSPQGAAAPGAAEAPAPGAKLSALALFETAGFKLTALEGGQICCDWKSSRGVFRILIISRDKAPKSVHHFSDWAVVFHPSAGRGAELPNAELKSAASRLASLRFEELLSAFTGLQDYYGGLKSCTGKTDQDSPASNPRRAHIAFGQWQRFVFPDAAEFPRIPPDICIVKHGDSECRFGECRGGALGMFSKDFFAPDRDWSAHYPCGPRLPAADPRMLNTDFQTLDAVYGDEEKIFGALKEAATRAGPGGLVELSVGCSPIRQGGDAEAAARRVEKETGAKVQITKYDSANDNGPERTAVRIAFLSRRLLRAKAKISHDVNLINYGGRAAGLTALLSAYKISAVESGDGFCGAASTARLQVLSGRDKILEPAFDGARMKWLCPPAPYGFAGTTAWLRALASALGRNKIRFSPSQEEKAEALKLRRRARAYGAALVLQADELALLSPENRPKLASVLPVLAEAGLGVQLFLPAAGPVGRQAADIAAIQAGVPGLRLAVRTFKTPDDLYGLLRADKSLRLVYSDVRGDSRVAAAGKSAFSTAHLEPGYAGALETWRRLLELCEWDFNERYFS